MPILFFFICCIKALFIYSFCGNLITYILENLGRFEDLHLLYFLYVWHLKIYSKSVSVALPFEIPIDLIHNTNQKINATISKRAKFVLAYIYIQTYIYIYICYVCFSLHINQCLFISISDCTFSSFQWHVLCKGQNIAKSCKITTFKNPPPSLPSLGLLSIHL